MSSGVWLPFCNHKDMRKSEQVEYLFSKVRGMRREEAWGFQIRESLYSPYWLNIFNLKIWTLRCSKIKNALGVVCWHSEDFRGCWGVGSVAKRADCCTRVKKWVQISSIHVKTRCGQALVTPTLGGWRCLQGSAEHREMSISRDGERLKRINKVIR